MLKKFIKQNVIFITLFYFCSNSVFAYEFYDSENKDNVYNMIREIYESKQQYIDLAGDYDEEDINILNSTSSSYWWPIGSIETVSLGSKTFAIGQPETVRITSNWGYRNDPFGRGKMFHNGLDIAGGRGLGKVSIIAAKDGVVVYPTAGVANNCASGNTLNRCGGGYGNYVIIQHNDGNYTLYAHLYENSITVKAGESVKQGQVIGMIGSSGNSTGAHLHFEVRVGNNSSSSTDDPLNYISATEPRKLTSNNELLNFIKSWDYTTQINNDSYVIETLSNQNRIVGNGVVLEHNSDKFKKYGIDILEYTAGSNMLISTVDQIQSEIIEESRANIENILVNNSIKLEQNQIDALVSIMYTCGNINGFVENYKESGNTDDFYENWFLTHEGIKLKNISTERRNAEWTLFNKGIYVFNG